MTMAQSPKLINRFEATTVYSPPNAAADIVLVHGLNGAPDHTWTASNGVFWPLHLLAPSLIDTPANVIVYGYNADVASWKKDSLPADNFVFQHAQNLVASLTAHRRNAGTSRLPIIWVAHSLGGIVLKRALLYSNDIRDPELDSLRSIFISTYAAIFLGTPHTGSPHASWGHVLQAMSGVIPRKIFDSEPILLKTLKKDNEVLQDINNHFLDIYQRFKIHMARENHKTDLKYTVDFVVDSKSAGPQLPGVTYYSIEATHSGMCKFGSADAPGYSTVSSSIRDWISEAPESIQTRWQVEEEERAARAMNRANELVKQAGTPSIGHTLRKPLQGSSLGSSIHFEPGSAMTSPPPSYANSPLPTQASSRLAAGESPDTAASSTLLDEPARADLQPLVIPYKPRPNSHFKGRRQELEELHHYLTDRDRRRVGTSAVLLQSLPGGGKTHLAREYIYLYGNKYTGGIFWVQARSEQEMEDAFWKIASAKTLHEFDNEPWRRDLLDSKRMVEAVRNWFERFEDWLIVFDGIHFDTPREANFIPNAKNTSILYTSTNRAVEGDHKFANPVLMELGRLSQQDAQELLLEEMGRRPPWSQIELSEAARAVELMDRLPLMIHVAALHLKATREPLVKYVLAFRDRRKAGTLDAYKSVRDELQRRGETEALNLMYILAFFAPSIPVEMIALGVKGLDKRTPVKSSDAADRKSLSNTLTVLIRWALIGRNENEDNSSASSASSPSAARLLSDHLDTLKLHAIIQAFFIDTLVHSREAGFWLERAVTVFCHSYDAADRRIAQDPRLGLPDDYRRYQIHGKQILRHLSHLGKKYPQLSASRIQLRKRLDAIDIAIEDFTQAISEPLISGQPDSVPRSVFDAAGSFSDSDSTRTSQGSTPSFREDRERSFIPDTYPEFVDSPTWFEGGIYPFNQTPYPIYDAFPIPSLPEDTEITNEARTPRPERPSRSSTRPGDTTDPTNHRTVKKLEERRYHDRAGSMREVQAAYADARLTVHRENVQGVISSQLSDTASNNGAATETSGDSDARLQLLKLNKSSPPHKNEKSKTVGPGASDPSLLARILGKTFRLVPVARGNDGNGAGQLGNGKGQANPIPSMALPVHASAGNQHVSHSPLMDSPLTRTSSPESWGYHDRLSKSELVQATMTGLSPDLSGQEDGPSRRGGSAPPSRPVMGGAYLDDDDLRMGFPPDGPADDPFSVDMPVWPEEGLQPTGYTSQPMSRQTSDNPVAGPGRAGGAYRGATPRSLGSAFATPTSFPRRRRPSHVETEPSPRLPGSDSGPYQDWGERHGVVRGRARFGTVVAGGSGSRAGRARAVSFGDETPASGGIVTEDGAFVEFGVGGTGKRVEISAADRERDLVGIGLGILGPSSSPP